MLQYNERIFIRVFYLRSVRILWQNPPKLPRRQRRLPLITFPKKNSGFLPEERAWMDQLFGSWGYVDAFRLHNAEPEQYTWWSNRGQARAKNVGWRIDYQMVTPDLKDKIKNVHVYREKFFSDHAPLIIDYDFVL